MLIINMELNNMRQNKKTKDIIKYLGTKCTCEDRKGMTATAPSGICLFLDDATGLYEKVDGKKIIINRSYYYNASA